jgi:Ca-activated chloride channel family protein
MLLPVEFQIPIGIALAVLVLVLAAEKLHERRCRVAARLATGPTGQPRRWVASLPLLRAVCLAAMAWAGATLYFASGGVFQAAESDAERRERHQQIVFVADLSPSMLLEDAGPERDLQRLERANQVVDAILRRIDGDAVYSVIGFYTTAMPVIVDAQDAELVRNVFDGLPVWYVMEEGKTDLGTGVRLALEHLAEYPAGSTTVFVCTDGDTVGIGSIPKPPESVRQVYVLGVGDPLQGTFIDDHISRQDAATLRTLAGRMGGEYIDVNEKHLSTLALGTLAAGVGGVKDTMNLTDFAIYLFAAAALVLAVLPMMLEYFGSDWKPVRVPSLRP